MICKVHGHCCAPAQCVSGGHACVVYPGTPKATIVPPKSQGCSATASASGTTSAVTAAASTAPPPAVATSVAAAAASSSEWSKMTAGDYLHLGHLHGGHQCDTNADCCETTVCSHFTNAHGGKRRCRYGYGSTAPNFVTPPKHHNGGKHCALVKEWTKKVGDYRSTSSKPCAKTGYCDPTTPFTYVSDLAMRVSVF